jgi:flagellar transcriptional activator FlhD
MESTSQAGQLNDSILSEIRDSNLGYLMLAQKMIRLDKPSALYRLGISESIADLIESFSSLQMIKLASSNVMLTRFRFEDEIILAIVSNYQKPLELAAIHSTLLLGSQSPETVT